MKIETKAIERAPRPDIHAAETYALAAREFFRVKSAPCASGDVDEADKIEEAILNALRSRDGCREAWELSQDVERLLGARVQGLAAYCVELLEYAAEVQDLLQYDWVKDNGVEDPVPSPKRVVGRRWTGVRFVEEEGLALPGGDCVLLGMFRFLSDRRRADVEGEIFSTLVLPWEDILREMPLTADDVDLLRRSDQAAAKRETLQKAHAQNTLEMSE